MAAKRKKGIPPEINLPKPPKEKKIPKAPKEKKSRKPKTPK
jgi:hypothetical protein